MLINNITWRIREALGYGTTAAAYPGGSLKTVITRPPLFTRNSPKKSMPFMVLFYINFPVFIGKKITLTRQIIIFNNLSLQSNKI